MQKIPPACYRVRSNIIFTIAVALFFLLFAVLYVPTFGFEASTLARWSGHSDFCIAILSAIVLVAVALSRLLMVVLTRRHHLNEREYFAWQLCELVVVCLFADLFLALYFHQSYFLMLPRTLAIGAAVAVYPYAVYWLLLEYQDRARRLADADATVQRLRQGLDNAASASINFPDENGNIKLAVRADRVIAIESAGNYVTILYEDDESLARFALRNTLKFIDTLCEGTSLARCHRSFFVNIDKIRLLRKDPSGLYAEINVAGVADIPVSKTYASAIMQRFSEK